jgi:hypothetical protein
VRSYGDLDKHLFSVFFRGFRGKRLSFLPHPRHKQFAHAVRSYGDPDQHLSLRVLPWIPWQLIFFFCALCALCGKVL